MESGALFSVGTDTQSI